MKLIPTMSRNHEKIDMLWLGEHCDEIVNEIVSEQDSLINFQGKKGNAQQNS